jgi:quercetin dioxygenase-like cupin family protein
LGGPGFAGSGIRGGVSRRVSKGDMVIIPAGTPHGFTEVQETITYTIVRIDPSRLLALK